jgi:hypothetical protein
MGEYKSDEINNGKVMYHECVQVMEKTGKALRVIEEEMRRVVFSRNGRSLHSTVL